jgi:hypothetical protein
VKCFGFHASLSDASTCPATHGIGHQAQKEKRRKDQTRDPGCGTGISGQRKNDSQDSYDCENDHPSQHCFSPFGQNPALSSKQVDDQSKHRLFAINGFFRSAEATHFAAEFASHWNPLFACWAPSVAERDLPSRPYHPARISNQRPMKTPSG